MQRQVLLLLLQLVLLVLLHLVQPLDLQARLHAPAVLTRCVCTQTNSLGLTAAPR